MSIVINNLIIHQINKQQPGKGQSKQNATLIDSKVEIQTQQQDDWHRLVETALKSTNEDRRLRRGRFLPNKGFKDEYDDYKNSVTTFIDLSLLVTNKLMSEMNKSTMSTGGFILFADIVENNAQYFYCIMFKEQVGDNLVYNSATQTFELKDVNFLNLEKMHQGFGLEVDSYIALQQSKLLFKQDEKPYLYFINMQKSDKTSTSDYFIDTFSCIVNESSANSMSILLNKTVNYFETNTKLSKYASEIKNSIQDYYKNCHINQQDIELAKVENIIVGYAAKEQFTAKDQKDFVDQWFNDLVHAKTMPISAVFTVDEAQLKKYGTVDLKIDGYRFLGQKDKLLVSTNSDDVYYDPVNLTVTLNLKAPIN